MAEGIRKINEYVMTPGRTVVVTDPNLSFTNFEDGTLLIDASANVKVKKSAQTDWINFTPSNLFLNKSISSNLIADGTITNQQIASATILEKNIKDSEITTSKILDSAITTAKISNSAVTNDKILNSTIKNEKIANGTLTNIKLADLTIETGKLKDACVTTAKINTSAVTTDKINALAVTTAKINDAAVTTGKINDSAVTEIKIATNAVTNTKIYNNAVTADKISDSAITTNKINNAAVTTAKIANAAVTTAELGNSAVTTAKILDGAITTIKIGENQVTSDKLSKTLISAINTSVKLDATGIASVNGGFYVKNNITCDGTITATKVYNAVYNDLAEGYVPGESLVPGTITEIREDGKVYKATSLSSAIVGVVSDEFAECYGASEEELLSGKKVAVGLIGKVHVLVKGPVKVGDRIISAGDGYGYAGTHRSHLGIVGKALETSHDNGFHKVLCLIYPN